MPSFAALVGFTALRLPTGARRSGLEPIGTLGLLLAARRAGIIQAVSPEIEALRKEGFHASDALVQRILAEAEEQ